MAITKQDLMKMPIWQKGLILVAVIGLVGLGWYYLLYSPAQGQIPTLKSRLQILDKKIKDQEQAKRDRVNLKAEIDKIQKELDQLKTQLPEEKEIPALLSGVNEVGRSNGLDFVLFKQENAARKSFYSEIPIQIKVQGSFHQVAKFLAEVGTMDRILQVSGLRMGNYKSSNGGGYLQTSMRATTYKWESTPLPATKRPGRRKR